MSEDESFENETALSSTESERTTTPAPVDLLRAAADPDLTEDLALALLKRPDLHSEVLEQLAKSANALKSRKVKIALASHPHTPRHVSVPLARQFYTFDLMKVALAPLAPADVKVAVDDVLISRLKTVTIGERLTLARRASGRVAAALLLGVEIAGAKTAGAKIIDAKTVARETRVMQTALENPRLTEALVFNSAQPWSMRSHNTRSGPAAEKFVPPCCEPNISHWPERWNSALKSPRRCCTNYSPVRVSPLKSKTNSSARIPRNRKVLWRGIRRRPSLE
jgi:hypothetical protein